MSNIENFTNLLISRFPYSSVKCTGGNYSKSQAINTIIQCCKNKKIQSLDFYKYIKDMNESNLKEQLNNLTNKTLETILRIILWQTQESIMNCPMMHSIVSDEEAEFANQRPK